MRNKQSLIVTLSKGHELKLFLPPLVHRVYLVP